MSDLFIVAGRLRSLQVELGPVQILNGEDEKSFDERHCDSLA